eukprot:maker-scaffold395_size185061-snap-gene-0.32 protein:Tk08339 transcript:maker-scaffold395_size185061-snap-gene-0.32-mRNA-1 annotation:"guanylate cyclase 32e"
MAFPVSADHIASATIASATIASATIASATIASATIASATIASASIASASIASATIASATIASATIASATIASATIAWATIASATIASATIALATIASATIASALPTAPCQVDGCRRVFPNHGSYDGSHYISQFGSDKTFRQLTGVPEIPRASIFVKRRSLSTVESCTHVKGSHANNQPRLPGLHPLALGHKPGPLLPNDFAFTHIGNLAGCRQLPGEVNVQMLQLRREAAYLYDAVHLYAKSLKQVLLNGGDPFNGTQIIQNLLNRSYTSAMGYKMFMDSNGDTEGNYTLVALKQSNNGKYGLFPVGMFQMRPGSLPKLHLSQNLTWPRGSPPEAIPRCGFKGEFCLQEETDQDIIYGVFLGFGVVILVVMGVLYRNYKYEQELDSLLWKIDAKELKVDDSSPSRTHYNKYQIAHGRMGRNSQVSLGSHQEHDHRFSTIYTQIGIYKGRIYAVKKSPKYSIDITRKLKKELKAMRDIHHDNLNHFIGACVEPGNVCIVNEYCTRGSLRYLGSGGSMISSLTLLLHFRDILDNEDMNLDNMFIASLVGDMVRGMIFLHDSQLRFHGNLKAGNCLVDSRWVLKLSGFGLNDFSPAWPNVLDVLTNAMQLEPSDCEELLYRAPEFLRLKDPSKLLDSRYLTASEAMLQKADVYSFAVLLFEIHFRPKTPLLAFTRNRVGTRPFGDLDMTPTEVLERVYNPHIQLRPQIDALENCLDFVKACMKDAWHESPIERPDFKVIRARLRPMRRGMKANIFDNMLAMMEKYANNLEGIVDERTQLLIDEKRKTEALLYEMLPRTVAEQLKQGKRVDAENFDTVTIYFSDIVGFTNMCAESSPLQVVDFLNDLYTCFDSTIEIYDVYKSSYNCFQVETIGDAYMVVSGLPLRNADQHAGEIASMALNLLEKVKRFQIRHRPNDALMLRIGIHSGPVCAGVVGRKMPRFCLFGDTVNTASRMETMGVPHKIHCSFSCQQILSKLGGYELEERGFISLKGKGDQLTFWLLSEDPYIREQRMKDRAAQLKTQKRPASM